MRKFDWRRLSHWTRATATASNLIAITHIGRDFDGADLRRRYPDGKSMATRPGPNLYVSSSKCLTRLIPREELTRRRLEIVDDFFADVANSFAKPPTACVFVSHQRLDTHRGNGSRV